MNQTQNIKLSAEISATSKGLVEALNKATGAINDTSNNWKAKFNTLKDSTSMIGQSVKNLADLVSQVGKVDMDVEGLDKIHANIAEVSGAFDKVKGEVDTFVTSLVDLKNAASGLGMPVEEYQRFADAVKASGLSIEEGVGMLQTMRQSIADFANGVPEVVDKFGRLGLTIEQLSSNTVTGNFDAIVQALQSVVQPTEQARASMEQFQTSMEHAVKVSQEYNKLLVDQTNNAYATDKDVQNAIGLSNAIGKLADQFAGYAQNASGASTANSAVSRSFEDVYNIVKRNQDELNALVVEYENYVSSLKRGATSTLDASQALDVFKTKVRDTYDALAFKRELGYEVEPQARIKKNLASLLEFLEVSKERIKDEMDAVRTIMEQRIHAGAPVETKEMETAISHINTLSESIEELKKSFVFSGLRIPDESLASISELNDYLDASLVTFQQLSHRVNSTNSSLFFDTAKQAVDAFVNKLNKAREDARRGILVHVDSTELDQASEKLAKVIPYDNTSYNRSAINDLMTQIDQLMSKVSAHNEEVSRGVSFWKQVKIAIADCWNALKGTNSSADDTSGTLQRIGGQLLGMGSKVAIIVKGFREAGKMLSLWVDHFVRANEEARKLQTIMSSAWTKTAEDNQHRFEAIEQEMQEYSELLRKWRESGNATDRNALDLKGRDISLKYGIDVTPENFDDVLRNTLDWTKNGRRDAIESQIRSLEKMNESLDAEYKERDSYLKNDLGRSLDEKLRGKERMVEIAKEKDANNAKIMALREQLRLIMGENKLEDIYLAERAREQDHIAEAKHAAEEEARKEQEEQAKALEDANRKLEDWGNSLSDNDRQKGLREIIDKYNSLVQDGVNAEEARVVATKAIEELLKKERDEEEKHNRELVQALQDRIDQYKDAYQSYLASERDLQDARREERELIRQQNRDRRAESLQRKRDRIQERLSQFGFTPYEGFRLDESETRRARRRRNAELDAGISEKMERSQAGERVSWTRQERQRILDYQRLQRRDKQLEAAQKQMDAAERQRQAADALKEAAKAINNAIAGRNEAIGNLRGNASELRGALGNRPVMSRNGRADQVLWNALRYGLNARGVSGAWSQNQGNYNQQLNQLHTDLQQIQRNVYLVR